MKATADAKALAQAVARVAPFTARWAGNEALTAIHVQTEGESLRLTATDLEHSATTLCPATVHDAGVPMAPAGTLGKALAVMSGEVALAYEDGDLALAAGTKAFTVRTGDADSFPQLTWPEADTAMGEAWADIAAVAVAASVKLEKPVLAALNFEDGTVSATDSFRLHWAPIPAGLVGLVPAGAVLRASKALDGDVSMGIDERSAVFTDGTTTIATRLTMGNGLAWRELASRDKPLALAVDAAELTDALAAAAAIAGPDASGSVRMALEDGTLSVSRLNSDIGTSLVTTDAEGEWPEPRVLVNSDYLAAAVHAVGGEQVVIRSSTPQQHLLITGERVSALLMTVNLT